MRYKTIGLIYGSDTGITEEITHTIVAQWEHCPVEVIEVTQVKKTDFERFDLFILGLSTWYDGDLQSDWETYFEEFQTIDFTGKTFAIFGLGDQYGYGEYFIDGVGILATTILKNNGNIIGHWSVEDYDFETSKAQYNATHFYGLALDEDNQPELTQSRINDWLTTLKNEMPYTIS